jgi:RNA polymerase-binding transcription factor DksA
VSEFSTNQAANETTDQTMDQKRQVAAKLSARRAELIGEIRAELERSGHQRYLDLSGEVADAGEESVGNMLLDFDIAMVKLQVEELLQVEQAQKRVATAEFNVCEQCGGEIGFARLMASPAASRCVVCQAQHEKFYGREEAS